MNIEKKFCKACGEEIDDGRLDTTWPLGSAQEEIIVNYNNLNAECRKGIADTLYRHSESASTEPINSATCCTVENSFQTHIIQIYNALAEDSRKIIAGELYAHSEDTSALPDDIMAQTQ